MTETMVERLSREIDRIAWEWGYTGLPHEMSVQQAEAILAAMREPSEAMAIAASSWVCDGNANGAQWIDTADIYPMWNAAINAALQVTSE